MIECWFQPKSRDKWSESVKMFVGKGLFLEAPKGKGRI